MDCILEAGTRYILTMQATALSQSLKGKLLLSTPTIGDPRFRKSVIFIISHDAKGAMGFMVNIPLESLDFAGLLKETGLVDVSIRRENIRLINGGPVDIQHGFLLHTADFSHEHTVPVTDGVSVSANLEALQAFAEGECPREGLMVLGYSGWGEGQLDQELHENAWLVVDADYDILFNTPLEDRWDRAYSRLGVNPVQMTPEAGTA